MKRTTCIILLVMIMAVSMSTMLSVSAFAEAGSVAVTIDKGDTVYCICQELGLSYEKSKERIISLNGFTSEAQLSKVKVGDKLLFPTSDVKEELPKIPEGDSIAYYLMPYQIKEGDYLYGIYNLWGLDYDDYADDILYMNYIPNPDKLPIGQLLWLPTDARNLMGKDYTTVAAHTMEKGETAYDVCKSYGMDYYEVADHVAEFNCGCDLTKLKIGQVLKIPLS